MLDFTTNEIKLRTQEYYLNKYNDNRDVFFYFFLCELFKDDAFLYQLIEDFRLQCAAMKDNFNHHKKLITLAEWLLGYIWEKEDKTNKYWNIIYIFLSETGLGERGYFYGLARYLFNLSH